MFGAIVLFGGRSETIRGIIVALAVELARGHDGSPYGWLGAVAGLAYLAAVVVFRMRG